MDSYRFQELLQKLSHGTILPEEKKQLQQVLETLPPDAPDYLFPEEDAAIAATPPSTAEIASSHIAYQAVWQYLQEHTAPVIPATRRWWQSSWAKAACIAGIIALSATLYLQWQRQATTTPTLTWKQTTTRPGERRMLTMADGTTIYLNGNSSIRYPLSFTDSIRQVELIAGEMFLEVQPDASKPFRVHTGAVGVNVLGTSFSIRNKAEEQQITTAVKTGKVAFYNQAANQLTLTSGQKGVFEKQSARLTQVTCATGNIGGWIKGVFEFEGATLSEILHTLQDCYGFQYTIHRPALANKRFKAAFSGQTPQEIMRALSSMGDFTYTLKDSTLTIQ